MAVCMGLCSVNSLSTNGISRPSRQIGEWEGKEGTISSIVLSVFKQWKQNMFTLLEYYQRK